MAMVATSVRSNPETTSPTSGAWGLIARGRVGGGVAATDDLAASRIVVNMRGRVVFSSGLCLVVFFVEIVMSVN